MFGAPAPDVGDWDGISGVILSRASPSCCSCQVNQQMKRELQMAQVTSVYPGGLEGETVPAGVVMGQWLSRASLSGVQGLPALGVLKATWIRAGDILFGIGAGFELALSSGYPCQVKQQDFLGS